MFDWIKKLIGGNFTLKKIDDANYECKPYHFKFVKHPIKGDIGVLMTSIVRFDIDLAQIPDTIKKYGGEIISWNFGSGLFSTKEDRLKFIYKILPELMMIFKNNRKI